MHNDKRVNWEYQILRRKPCQRDFFQPTIEVNFDERAKNKKKLRKKSILLNFFPLLQIKAFCFADALKNNKHCQKKLRNVKTFLPFVVHFSQFVANYWSLSTYKTGPCFGYPFCILSLKLIPWSFQKIQFKTWSEFHIPFQ
jgi:hypothetical protein